MTFNGLYHFYVNPSYANKAAKRARCRRIELTHAMKTGALTTYQHGKRLVTTVGDVVAWTKAGKLKTP